MENIRYYNSAFAFASLYANFGQFEREICNFKIHEKVFHSISLIFPQNEKIKHNMSEFIFFIRNKKSIYNTMSRFDCLNRIFLDYLKIMIHRENPYYHILKTCK